MEKTNVMRLLDKEKINYKYYRHDFDANTNGYTISKKLNENPNQVFKTLVTVGKSKMNYVFLVPVNSELDLKKAALSVNEKSIEMIKSRELFNLTGYVHGGCSPIGMRKNFKTIIDSSAKEFETIIFSGGKVGYQVQVNIIDLNKIINYEFSDVKVF